MIAAIAIALLALASAIPPFPFHTYQDIQAAQVGQTCPDGNVTDLRTLDGEYRILSTKDRDIFIHLTEAGADYVYFAKGTAADGQIHVVHAYAIDEAKAAYPAGPCSYFSEVEA